VVGAAALSSVDNRTFVWFPRALMLYPGVWRQEEARAEGIGIYLVVAHSEGERDQFQFGGNDNRYSTMRDPNLARPNQMDQD